MLQSGLTCPSISICPLSATGELFMTKENPGSFSLVNPWMRTHHPRAWPYNFIVNAGPCLAWLCARIPKWPYIRLLPQPVFPPAHSPLPPHPLLAWLLHFSRFWMLSRCLSSMVTPLCTHRLDTSLGLSNGASGLSYSSGYVWSLTQEETYCCHFAKQWHCQTTF